MCIISGLIGNYELYFPCTVYRAIQFSLLLKYRAECFYMFGNRVIWIILCILLYYYLIMSESKETHVIPNYLIVFDESVLLQIDDYRRSLLENKVKPGFYLHQSIRTYTETGGSLKDITNEKFVNLLLATKIPCIFAEEELRCDGSDWNILEIKILGDVTIVMPVQIFDNGIWSVKDSRFKEHDPPLEGELLFVPGPLLSERGDLVGQTPEFLEVVIDNKIDQNKYNKLIERKLSPLFTYVNENAKKGNRSAIITVPGIGCGAFAGKFSGTLGENLNQALQYIIEKNSKYYTHIACIYYDPYHECNVESKEFFGIKYRVRPYYRCGKSQLCSPKNYEESSDDFSTCKLYKIVAWDHLSFPGNDYYVGQRATDDGVAAAATNSMEVITGIKGNYSCGYYLPPKGKRNWEQIVNENKVQLIANGNVYVVTESGSYLNLNEYKVSTLPHS